MENPHPLHQKRPRPSTEDTTNITVRHHHQNLINSGREVGVGMSHRYRHPANIARWAHSDRISRLEDSITSMLGSGKFLVGQTIVVVAWLALNVTAVAEHWDPYP